MASQPASHNIGARSPRERTPICSRSLITTIRLASPGCKPTRRNSEAARHKALSSASANLPASSFNPASMRSVTRRAPFRAADLTEASRFPNRGRTDSRRRRRICAMPSAFRLREDYRRQICAGWPAGRRTSTRAGGFCRWQEFETEWTEGGREDRRHGPPDASRLGSPIQRLGSGWTSRRLDRRSEAAPVIRADGRGRPNVEAGPEREKDGVVRWRRVDLKRVIAERFGVDFHERYVGTLLKKKLGCSS